MIDAAEAVGAVDLLNSIDRSRVNVGGLSLEADADVLDRAGDDRVADAGKGAGEVVLPKGEGLGRGVAVPAQSKRAAFSTRISGGNARYHAGATGWSRDVCGGLNLREEALAGLKERELERHARSDTNKGSGSS